MSNRLYSPAYVISATAILVTALSTASPAQAEQSFASDNGSYKGDKITTYAGTNGFKIGATNICAPKNTTLYVTNDDGKVVTGYVTSVPSDDKDIATCPRRSGNDNFTPELKEGQQLIISREDIEAAWVRRTGFTFGGLVVPFKYRIASRELVGSGAVAPYIGWRTGYGQLLGINITPIVAAGLSLVAVPRQEAEGTDTKAAFTSAFGFRLTSTKNDQFSGGVLFGRDFLNKQDRLTDKNANKPWLSVYLGVSI